jgi:hypothetical protein
MGPNSKFAKESRSKLIQEWQAAQHQAFLEAEGATRGNMVRKGAPAHVQPSSFYPAAPGHRPPFRWASDDLKDYWERQGGARPIPYSVFARDWASQFQAPLEF